MKNQKVNDYFKMLGEVFEWICYESDTEVSLSAVYKDEGEYKMKPNLFDNKSSLCIATIMDSCKAFDEKNGTEYYNKFMLARKNGVDHN